MASCRNVQALFKTEQNYKYANHMQIMNIINIYEVDVKKWISHCSKRNKIHVVGF